MIENIIIIGVLLAVIGAAAGYIVYAKRKGQKCIGCPYAKNCAKNSDGSGCCGSSAMK